VNLLNFSCIACKYFDARDLKVTHEVGISSSLLPLPAREEKVILFLQYFLVHTHDKLLLEDLLRLKSTATKQAATESD
jgi:hypothetical protein